MHTLYLLESFFFFSQCVNHHRDLRPASRNEYTVQIQLRFCLSETTCSQKDEFPPSICVRVNGKVATLPVSEYANCKIIIISNENYVEEFF